MEVLPFGIRVALVKPGVINTSFQQKAKNETGKLIIQILGGELLFLRYY